MSSGANEQESKSSAQAERLSEIQACVKGEEAKDEPREEGQEDERARPAPSSPEPASDDDQADSPRTVRSTSPSGAINRQQAPSVDRPLELSVRDLLLAQQHASSGGGPELESRETRSHMDLEVAGTSGWCEQESISVQTQEQQQPRPREQDRAPTISSMHTRSSPSSSFRYCYREHADGAGINYHSNERAATGNQRPGANDDMMRAFAEAQPKLSFASKRMKEYFESLSRRTGGGRPSPGSRRHQLYQFFKCTRTELVACLVFSVIVCQTLITCRVHQWGASVSLSESEPENLLCGQPPAPNQPAHSLSSEASARAQVAVQPQLGQQQEQQQHQPHQVRHQNSNQQNSAQLHVHLIGALAAAFGAATLTQVFGHISGCHLVPAVSLALYFKGHISRARLGSYLAAQSVGPLAGVALLSLLTASQTSSPSEHREALNEALVHLATPIEAGLAGGASEPIVPPTTNRLMRHRREPAGGHNALATTDPRPALSSATQATLAHEQRDHSKRFAPHSAGAKVMRPARRRRQAPASSEADASAPAEAANETHENGPAPGSEAILLSIMEQKERELGSRQQQSRAAATSAARQAAPPLTTFEARQQAGALFNRISKSDTSGAQDDQIQSASPRAPAVSPVADADGAAPSSPAPLEPRGSAHTNDNWTHESGRNATLVAAGQLVMVPLVTSQNVSDHASGSLGATSASSHTARLEIEPAPAPAPAEEEPRRGQPSRRLRLKQRTRRQQQQQQPNVNSTSAQTSGISPSSHEWAARSISSSHSNLLEFALPASIMSSGSMRACIKQQYAQVMGAGASHRGPDRVELSAAEQRALHRLQLVNCAALSNGSQMFIFQLLATLLVVLTYLVNVDPRRVDVGFKSLSIGLAYFLAHLLTLTSGGFYGNPSELLALLWFSSRAASDVWHSEWLVYLVVPLVGALFGALSHEYIDFTSLRNRNKKLHLRRSFYSLESLADTALTHKEAHLAGQPLSAPRRPTHRAHTHEAARQTAGHTETPQAQEERNRQLSGSVSSASGAVKRAQADFSSSSRGGSQTSVMALNEPLSETDPPLARRPRQRRESNQSSTRQPASHQHSRGPLSAKSSPLSVGSRQQAVAADLLLDSNFLICCANGGQPQATESRPSWGQGTRASSLGCQREPNGARRLAASTKPFCHAPPARNNQLPSAQFVCTSQFM